MTPTTVPLADLLARVPDGVGIDVPGPEGGWAVAVIGGRVYRARVAPVAEKIGEIDGVPVYIDPDLPGRTGQLR